MAVTLQGSTQSWEQIIFQTFYVYPPVYISLMIYGSRFKKQNLTFRARIASWSFPQKVLTWRGERKAMGRV